MSSDCEAVQGLCTLQLELKPGRLSATASPLDVLQAAVAVIGTCVAGTGRNTGGLAINIGEYVDENLDYRGSRMSSRCSPRSTQAETTI